MLVLLSGLAVWGAPAKTSGHSAGPDGSALQVAPWELCRQA